MDFLPKKTLVIALVIVLIVVLISAMGTAAFSSLFYQSVPSDKGWTPGSTKTPAEVQSDNQVHLTIEITQKSSATAITLPSATFSLNCTYPAEYWIEHTELWPEYTILGNYQYTSDVIQKILSEQSTSVRDDLVLQMYFTNLNISNNAENGSIIETLDGANSWLTMYANVYPLSDEAHELGIGLAGMLGEFNAGIVGPGPCEPFQAPTRTPVGLSITLTSLATPTATLTPTRYFVTVQPTASMTPTATREDADKPRWPTNTSNPITNTPVPQQPTSTNAPPPPTEAPTSAPPENTPAPTQPPEPTTPPEPSTPAP